MHFIDNNMDATAAYNAISKLCDQYPQLSGDTITDVFEQCDQDPIQAYNFLSDMLCPQPQSSTPNYHNDIDTDNDNMLVTSNITHATPLPAAPLLQGAWADANIGRKYRVDEMCKIYPWLDKKAAYSLFEKYNDSTDLVEADVLEMFPIDQPSVYATVYASSSYSTTATTRNNAYIVNNNNNCNNMSLPCTTTTTLQNPNPNGHIHDRDKNSMFPSRQQQLTYDPLSLTLRKEAEAEMRQVANPSPKISIDSPLIKKLRSDVWDKREIARTANRVASQTRKASLVADAQARNDELHKLSAYMLERIRETVEYQAGVIDLHHLTKDEAIQLVDWKIEDCSSVSSVSCPTSTISSCSLSPACSSSSTSPNKTKCTTNMNRRRFQLITGKGNNSLNHQAVLRPAIERYLRSKGVPFSSCQDGIITVTP